MRELLNDAPVLPGVVDYLDAADRRGMKLAVASSSSRDWVEGHLTRLGLIQRFEAICTKDDVPRVKPDPALYLLAAERLGVSVQRALVLEDSRNGLLAAKAAGVRCVVVPNAVTSGLNFDEADYWLMSLDEMSLDNLLAILEGPFLPACSTPPPIYASPGIEYQKHHHSPFAMLTFPCDAILFDLDGVLADSREVVERQWRLWAARHGVDAAQLMPTIHGRRAVETIAQFAPHLNAAAEERDLAAREAADFDGVREIPGAHALIASLPPDAWAVATSGARIIAGARLQHVGIVPPAVMVTADDVARGKPAPDPYRQAAQGLGIDPARCLVIEDAPVGVQAGHAAGARVVAVQTSHSADELREADAVVERLTDISVAVVEGQAGRLAVTVM